MTTQVIATDTEMAQTLTDIGSLGQGTLVSLTLRKKGVVRGGQIYGDDFVQVLMWTGFHYQALVERSNAKLTAEWRGHFLTDLLGEVHATGHLEATIRDVSEAVQEIQDNFREVMGGLKADRMLDSGVEPLTLPGKEMDEGTTLGGPPVSKPVFETLKVDGNVILGAKVYVGEGEEGNPRAPTPGTIYIDGVKLGEIVREPAPNGKWSPKQSAKTVAKEIIRKRLPVGLYVRYSLDREKLVTCKVGKEASAHAKEAGVPIDPEAIRSLFKIAP